MSASRGFEENARFPSKFPLKRKPRRITSKRKRCALLLFAHDLCVPNNYTREFNHAFVVQSVNFIDQSEELIKHQTVIVLIVIMLIIFV